MRVNSRNASGMCPSMSACEDGCLEDTCVTLRLLLSYSRRQATTTKWYGTENIRSDKGQEKTKGRGKSCGKSYTQRTCFKATRLTRRTRARGTAKREEPQRPVGSVELSQHQSVRQDRGDSRCETSPWDPTPLAPTRPLFRRSQRCPRILEDRFYARACAGGGCRAD